MKRNNKRTLKALLSLATVFAIGVSGTVMAGATAGNNKIYSDNGEAWNISNPLGTEENFYTWDTVVDQVTNYGSNYQVPVTLKTILAKGNYQVTLEWGNLALVYDVTEPTNGGWGNSFDSVNNKVTATNTGKLPVTVAMRYSNKTNINNADVEEDVTNLGLRITDENKQTDYSIDGITNTLQPAADADENDKAIGDSVSGYLNLGTNATNPDTEIDDAITIGTITVTVGKASS